MKNNLLVEGNIYVAGIYTMSTKTGKVLYVGSSLECNDALSRHLYSLKRGKYQETNKRALQEAYDRNDLVFTVIHISEHADEVKTMTAQQKEDLQKALSVLEELHIKLNAKTICNVQRSVTKHSSNHNSFSTYKRRQANSGINNPRTVYDEELVANILWLKEQGYKPKKIVEMLLEHDIEVTNTYISRLGIDRWIHLQSIKPSWINGEIAG
jgi:GIY-YIG catalytic domain.